MYWRHFHQLLWSVSAEALTGQHFEQANGSMSRKGQSGFDGRRWGNHSVNELRCWISAARRVGCTFDPPRKREISRKKKPPVNKMTESGRQGREPVNFVSDSLLFKIRPLVLIEGKSGSWARMTAHWRGERVVNAQRAPRASSPISLPSMPFAWNHAFRGHRHRNRHRKT